MPEAGSAKERNPMTLSARMFAVGGEAQAGGETSDITGVVP